MKKAMGHVLRYLLIIVTAVLMAAATYIFVIPNDFAPSGISGICVMIQYKLGISVGYLNLIANIPLCIIAFIMGYRNFAVKSYIFCIVFSASYIVMQYIDPAFLQYDAKGQDTILPVLIAGVLSGVATALCFEMGGSQCGTDVVSKILSEKKPEFNFFWISFTINSLVALSSLFVYADTEGGVLKLDYKPVALCVIYCLADSMIADVIEKNEREAAELIVITPHPDLVISEINKKTHHTSTMLEGTGTYSGENKKVLIFIVNKFQVPHIRRSIKNIPDTFSYVSPVSETIGWFDSRKVRNRVLSKKKSSERPDDRKSE